MRMSKAIIYGAGTDPKKWDAARLAYENMLFNLDGDAEFTFKSGVRVHAQRGKHSITITVQPEASK